MREITSKEFKLSEKMVHVKSWTFGSKSKEYPHPMIRQIDVKEFIKELKEELMNYNEEINNHIRFTPEIACEEIDKLAGPDLT